MLLENMTKEELDAEYEERLYELQQKCDHVLINVSAGSYGSDCYGTCKFCDVEIQFDARIARDQNEAESVELISWNRIGSREKNEAVLHRFGIILSHSDVEKYYSDARLFKTRNTLAEVILNLIKEKPYTTWAKCINR